MRRLDSADRSWVEALRFDPVPPLLASTTAAVRLLARRDLLGDPVDAVDALWQSPEVTHLVQRQLPSGAWRSPNPRTALRSVDQYNLLETYRVLGEFVEKHGLDKRHPAIRRASLYVLRHRSADGDIRGIYGTQYSPNYTAAIGGSGRPYRCSGATWTPHDESPARPARNRVTDVVPPCSSPRVVRGTRRGSPATRSERGLALYAATVSVRGLTPAPARVSPRPSSSAAR